MPLGEQLTAERRSKELRETVVFLVDVDGYAAVIRDCGACFDAALGELELIVKLAVGRRRHLVSAEVWFIEVVEGGDRIGPSKTVGDHDAVLQRV